MWYYHCWRLYKTSTFVKENIQEKFPYGRSLAEHQLLEEIKSRMLFGYVHCNIENPDKLKLHVATFNPLFRNIPVDRYDFG